jgi:hypothetical protein
MMKVVDESSGMGELMLHSLVLRKVRYRLTRLQGMLEGSGLPIPGLHRIEGSIELDPPLDTDEWIDIPLRLKLQDGSVLGITLVNREGRILNEGHGPTKCLCC